jgi:hypothetical protein
VFQIGVLLGFKCILCYFTYFIGHRSWRTTVKIVILNLKRFKSLTQTIYMISLRNKLNFIAWTIFMYLFVALFYSHTHAIIFTTYFIIRICMGSHYLSVKLISIVVYFLALSFTILLPYCNCIFFPAIERKIHMPVIRVTNTLLLWSSKIVCCNYRSSSSASSIQITRSRVISIGLSLISSSYLHPVSQVISSFWEFPTYSLCKFLA